VNNPAGEHLAHLIAIGAWIVAAGGFWIVRSACPSSSSQSSDIQPESASAGTRAASDSRRPQKAGGTWRTSPKALTDSVIARYVGVAQCAAVTFFAAACVHLSVMGEHFRQSWMYGLFFTFAAIFQVGYAACLLIKPSKVLIAMGMAASAGAIVVWVISRTFGVPVGPSAGLVEPVGPLDLMAVMAECGSIIYLAIALEKKVAAPCWRWKSWTWARLASVPVVAALVWITAIAYPPS